MKYKTWKFIVISVIAQLANAWIVPAYAVITSPQISNDQNNLYVSFSDVGTFAYYHTFIDTDMNANTGYTINGIGADRMMENAGGYKSLANGPVWSWSFLQSIVFNASNNQASWTIPLSALGVTAQCNTPINVVFGAQTSGGSGDLSAINQYKLNMGSNCVTWTSKIAVPSYIYPNCASNPACDWGRIDSAIPPVGLAVINPNSGPGSSISEDYLNQTQTTQKKGGTVLGYVYTSYGTRPISSVEADINAYYNWYKVDGIFFDEGYSSDCGKLSYYQTLNQYVKAKGGKGTTVINFGINTQECYINATDVVLEFENTYQAYTSWKSSGWETKYPANRFWHIIYNTPQANLQTTLQLANQRHAGYVYATPLTGSNPYGALPPAAYWSEEVALLKPSK